jgi:alanyl-tRNA synthetase
MEIQREKAREASTFGNIAEISDSLSSTVREQDAKFVGYDTIEAKANILEIQEIPIPTFDGQGDKIPAEVTGQSQLLYIITDVTPFYGESGGQVGDTGTIISSNGEAEVEGTIKTETNVIIHRVRVISGKFSKGLKVTLSVNASRRKSIMRHHSATHLLQRALRDVLGDHVHQSGSLVDEKRLRFDFTHFAALTEAEIRQVEDIVNQFVLENLPIRTEVLSKDQAMEKGAMALFTEKYGETVRVVTMGEGVSVELCGGTHCSSTGQIGLVKIASETSVSAGLRRIEAISGTCSLEFLRNLDNTVSAVADRLRCSASEILDRMAAMQAKIREQESTIKDLNVKIATGQGAAEDEKSFTAPVGKVVIKSLGISDIAQMREVGDRIKEQIKSGVVFLWAAGEDKATFMAMSTADKGNAYDAGKFMKHAMDTVGGRGGGKTLFAQGGADVKSVDTVIQLFMKSTGVEGE